jgi:hypothetical protein
MGRDKRKGKELVVEPLKKKKTHTQKEAECAATAARAADDQATSRGRRFQIREPRARTEEQQGEHPMTRGGHTECQDLSPRQQETRPRCSRATAQDRAEDREAATAVDRMDTAV